MYAGDARVGISNKRATHIGDTTRTYYSGTHAQVYGRTGAQVYGRTGAQVYGRTGEVHVGVRIGRTYWVQVYLYACKPVCTRI